MRRRVARKAWFLGALAAVATGVFLLVPDGGNLALLVLFGGLMALHHLPAADPHGGHGAQSAGDVPDDTSVDSEESPGRTCH